MEMSSGDIHIFHIIPLGCLDHKAESVSGVLEPDNLHLKTDVSMLIKVLSIFWGIRIFRDVADIHSNKSHRISFTT